MITPMAASFADARPDHHLLQKGNYVTYRSESLSGTVRHSAALIDPCLDAAAGVKENVFEFSTDDDRYLTGAHVQELMGVFFLKDFQVHNAPCHFVFSAEDYTADFAEQFEQALVVGGTVTLIDRSIMRRWNEDRAAISRLAVAEHALADLPPSRMILMDIGDPCDTDAAAEQFGRLFYNMCQEAMDFNHSLDIAEGVSLTWGAGADELYSAGQRDMALMALDFASGAVNALFPKIGIDPTVIDRTLNGLEAAMDVLNTADVDDDPECDHELVQF
jgi:hypothetical protein